MQPLIVTLKEKKIVGKTMLMTYSGNTTEKLWKSFMPERNKIINPESGDLYSIQIYPADFNFENFDLNAEFEKWAGMAVCDLSHTPEGMVSMILPAGLYAVFIHKGRASEGERTFNYIFGTWLPQSLYEVDSRPHFELLGDKYKHEEDDSEEEIWIPLKLRLK